MCRRLEADIKRLKSDLQSSRQLEQELRSQISSLQNGERQAKGDIQQLQHDNDQLQSKCVYTHTHSIISILLKLYLKDLFQYTYTRRYFYTIKYIFIYIHKYFYFG